MRFRRSAPTGAAWVQGAALLLGAAAFPPLAAQAPIEMGPFPFREAFPLFMLPMVYQPVDPTPVGEGRWRVSLDTLRANTFEFSDVLKQQAPRDSQGRVAITRDFIVARAADYAWAPLIFYFDEETSRTALRVRYGLTESVEAWGEFSFVSHGGGFLDRVIEGFHTLGFEQYGRDLVQQNRMALVVMAHGELVFYSDQGIRGKPQDPVLGVTARLASGGAWNVSAYASVKPPTTTMYDVFRSGWDHGAGITARWQPSPRHVLHGGAGFIRRPGGSDAYEHLAFGSMRDAWGAHLGWEWRPSARWRPYLNLIAQSGFLPPQPGQKLDRGSLQHDLGIHWQPGRSWALTFRYVNNVTHNENTADMGLGAALTWSF